MRLPRAVGRAALSVAPGALRSALFYLVLAALISWALALPLVLTRAGLARVPAELHFLVPFGPLLAGWAASALLGGRVRAAEFALRLGRWQAPALAWAVALGTLALAALLVIGAHRLEKGAWPPAGALGEVEEFGAIGPFALALWVVSYGFGEEAGWRGYLQHELTRFGWLAAALVVGVCWALWHLPFFFYRDAFLAMGPGEVAGWAASLLAGSVWLGWLYRASGASVPLVALWHGAFDFLVASPAATPGGQAAAGALVFGAVGAVLLGEARSRRARRRIPGA